MLHGISVYRHFHPLARRNDIVARRRNHSIHFESGRIRKLQGERAAADAGRAVAGKVRRGSDGIAKQPAVEQLGRDRILGPECYIYRRRSGGLSLSLLDLAAR